MPEPTPEDRALKAVPDANAHDRRITGEHWWDGDRAAHVEDLPRFCPSCGAGLDVDSGISVEYWEADQRIYHTWCKTCGWIGDIIRVHRMVGHEADH